MAETFVVDCSVAAKWILSEPGSTAAWGWYLRFRQGKVSLIAPDLILIEFASLLSKYYRRKLISAARGEDSYALFTDIAPPLFDTRPRLDAALALSVKCGASLWDCVYVMLAIEAECSCLTADERLFRSNIGQHASLRLLEESVNSL